MQPVTKRLIGEAARALSARALRAGARRLAIPAGAAILAGSCLCSSSVCADLLVPMDLEQTNHLKAVSYTHLTLPTKRIV